MKLQTQLPLHPEKHNQIDYGSQIMLLGSCFVENIGEKLDYYKFQNFQNPFGILFHPLALENLITNAINQKVYTDSDVFFNNDQWQCYEAHSKLSKTTKDAFLRLLNSRIEISRNYLIGASHLIITLGTAWVYRHIASDTIVANCHKVPQKQFLKELLTVDTIANSLEAMVALIKQINPNVTILFTISPVRHLKDGFTENSLSKAHLVSAVHHVVEPRNRIYYFPSYEIMLDELRDYRFYNEDLVHPNNLAVNYIWERFQHVWIHQSAFNTLEEVDNVQKGLNHKPFNPNSESYQKFLKELKIKQEKLQSKYAHMKF